MSEDMTRLHRRSLALGFVGAALVFGVLLWLVDGRAVLAALAAADPVFVGAIGAIALVWLLAWGLTLRTVLASLDVGISVRSSFLVYTAAVFANNVTPFGFAGGEAVTAFIVSKVTDSRYETGLVSIASVDVLNAASSVGLVVLGAGVYASSFGLGSGVQTAVGSGLVIVGVLGAVAVLAWRNRAGIISRISDPVARFIDRVAGGRLVADGVAATDVEDRLWRFSGNVEVIAADRRRLAQALSLSLSGWLLQAVALLAAFAALGEGVPFVVALFVLPLANIAGMTPLPGGLGGIEAAFVALLVPTTGIPAATVTAAVLLFRAAIYWLPVFLGGSVAAGYGISYIS